MVTGTTRREQRVGRHIVERPISSCTALIGAPRITRWLTKLWRQTCHVMSRSPARLHARHHLADVTGLFK